MKKLILILFFFQIVLFGQVTDSISYMSDNSINIKAIVQKQINDAILKKSDQQKSIVNEKEVLTVPAQNISLKVEEKNTNNAEYNLFTNLFAKIPLHYKIYLFLSTAIILGLIFRRSIYKLKKASVKKLKNRIALLREEKIGGSIIDPKKRKLRLELKENISLLKPSEIEIAKTAKQLNISKGELILAARLKFLEVNKIQGTL